MNNAYIFGKITTKPKLHTIFYLILISFIIIENSLFNFPLISHKHYLISAETQQNSGFNHMFEITNTHSTYNFHSHPTQVFFTCLPGNLIFLFKFR